MGSASPCWYLAWDRDCWMAVQRPSRCPAAGWCRTKLIVAQDYQMLEFKSTCSSPSCWRDFGSPGGKPIVDGYPWWSHCQSVETSCLLSGKGYVWNLGFPELLTFLHCQTKVKTCWALVVIHQVEVLVQLHVEFGWHNVWFELDTQCCLTIVEAEWLTCCRAKQFSIVDGHVVFWAVFFLAFACRISKTSSEKNSLVLSTHVDMSTVHLTLVVQKKCWTLSSKILNTCWLAEKVSCCLRQTCCHKRLQSCWPSCWGGKWRKRRYSESRLCWYTPCWSFNQVHGSRDVCRGART